MTPVESRDGGAAVSVGVPRETYPNERRVVRAKADTRLVLLLAPWPGEGHPRERAGRAAV